MTPGTRPSSWRTVKHLCGTYLRFYVLAWLAIVIVVGAVIAGFALFGRANISVFDAANYAPRYWIMVVGIFTTMSGMRQYISVGVTRRTFILAGTVTGLVTSIVSAALMAVSYALEYLVFEELGWQQRIEGPHLFADGSRFGSVFTEFALVFGVYFFVGWLIGSLFYRWAWWAVPALPFVYSGTIVVEAAIGTNWPGKVVGNLGVQPSLTLGLAAGGAIVIVMAAVNWLVLRDVPIQPKKS